MICHRNAVIIGPADTPFEDGTFRLVMHFEEQYPNKPPGVKFISQMFHPNVYGTGELCLDILQNRWSPTYDVAAVLTSIQRSVRAPRIRPTPSPAERSKRETKKNRFSCFPNYHIACACRGVSMSRANSSIVLWCVCVCNIEKLIWILEFSAF